MAGYVRQSSADIVTGADILAAPLNNEFNALQSAFHATTGHTHDGSTGNGPKITLTTSVSGILPVANGGAGLTSVDNTVPRYNGTTGILQSSTVTISDTGEIVAGVGTVTTSTSADQLAVVGGTVSGILIENTDITGSGFLTFGDGALAGRITYNHSTNAMTFNTNATLALTISSAGAGTFAGGLTATTGTFSGALSATTGTFSGLMTSPSAAIAGVTINTSSQILGALRLTGHADKSTSFISMPNATPAPDTITIQVGGNTIVNFTSGGVDGIKFDGVGNIADVNTLDDYEEGTWTPVFTFTTPGNLSVTYDTQAGTYTKIGRQVVARFFLDFATFTHTTASGSCTITLPFQPGAAGYTGSLLWQGITKAGYTDVVPYTSASSSTVFLIASGSGQAASGVAASDMPTGGSVRLEGTVTYFV